MQEADSPFASSVAENSPGSPALKPIQRRIVLGMLVGLYLLVAAMCPSALADKNSEYSSIAIWLGSSMVPLFLAAAWAAFSVRPIAKRIPEGFGLAAMVGLAILRGVSRTEALDISPVFFLLVTAIVPVLAAMLLMMLLRKFRGWRICFLEEQTAATKGRFQFSLLQMFAWTTFLAIILGLSAWIAPGQMQNFDAFDGESMLGYSIYVLVFLLLLSPIFLAVTGLILAQDRRRRFVSLLLHASLLAPILPLLTLALIENSQNPFSIIFNNDVPMLLALWLEISLIAVSLATMFFLRFSGYRLVRIAKPSSAKQSAWKNIWIKFALFSPTKVLQRIPPFSFLIAASLLAAATLCWPARIIEQANREAALDRAAEEEWRKLGAEIASVRQGEISNLAFSEKKPISQAALEKLKAADSQVSSSHASIYSIPFLSLSFSGSLLTDDQLQSLSTLKSIHTLNLANTPITDAGLVHLQGMASINDLDLGGTKVTDAGLKHLEDLRGITSLNLSRTGITDAGLVHLKRMKQLENLYLEEIAVTDDAIEPLKALPKLRILHLHLSKTKVTRQVMDKIIQTVGNIGIDTKNP